MFEERNIMCVKTRNVAQHRVARGQEGVGGKFSADSDGSVRHGSYNGMVTRVPNSICHAGNDAVK